MQLSKIQSNNPQLTEKQYRSIELESYSTLKCYAESPMKFYKTYVTKEVKREPDSRDTINGSLVHSLLATNDGTLDEEKFLIGTISEIDKDANHPSYFAWKIWELTDADIQANSGVQTRTFTSIAEEAFQLTKYDRSGNEIRFKKKELAYALEKFEGNLELWYKMKRSAHGRILVDMDDVTNAEKIVNDLKTYRDTSWIYTLQSNERYKVYKEMPVFFHHEGIDLKMMADGIIVDHQSRTVTPYDTKVGWNSNNFSKQYLDNWYYLQAIIYHTGIANGWMHEKGIEGYKLSPMQFVSVHSLCWYKPLIYRVTEKQLEDGRNGFTTKWGRNYPGMNEIVQNLQWSLENGEWKITRKDYENNSVKSIEY